MPVVKISTAKTSSSAVSDSLLPWGRNCGSADARTNAESPVQPKPCSSRLSLLALQDQLLSAAAGGSMLRHSTEVWARYGTRNLRTRSKEGTDELSGRANPCLTTLRWVP